MSPSRATAQTGAATPGDVGVVRAPADAPPQPKPPAEAELPRPPDANGRLRPAQPGCHGPLTPILEVWGLQVPRPPVTTTVGHGDRGPRVPFG